MDLSVAKKGVELKHRSRTSGKALAALVEDLSGAYDLVATQGSGKAEEKAAARLISQAEDALNKEDANAALEAAQDALGKFRKAKDNTGVADALRIASRVQNYLGDHEAAAKAVNEELTYYRDKNDRKGEAKMLLTLAEMDGEVEHQDALEAAKSALSFFKELQEPKMQAASLLTLSSVHLKRTEKGRGEAEDALQAARDARALYKDLKDSKGEALALHAIAAAYGIRKVRVATLKAAREALAIFKTLKLRKLEALELKHIAAFSLLFGKPKEALPVAEQAMELFQELDCGDGWEADALDIVFQAYLAKDDVAKAQQVAEEGLVRFQSRGDKIGEAACLDMLFLGNVARDDIGNVKAVQAAEEALGAYQELGDKKSELATQHAVCQLYHQSQQWSKCVEAAQRSIDLAKEMIDKEEQVNAMRLLAEVFVEKKDFTEALRVANEERQFCQDDQDSKKEIMALLFICRIYFAMEEYDEVLANAADAQAIAQETQDTQGEAAAWQTIARAQAAKNDEAAGLKAAERARRLFEETGQRYDEANTWLMIAQLHMTKLSAIDIRENDPEESRDVVDTAIQAAGEAVSLARRLEDPYISASAWYTITQAHMIVHQWQDALKGVEESARLYRSGGDEVNEAYSLILQCDIYLMSDRIQDAVTPGTKALELFRRHADANGEALAMQALDNAGQAQERPWAAEDSVNQGPEAVLEAVRAVKKTTMSDLARSLLHLGEQELENDGPLIQCGVNAPNKNAFHSRLRGALLGEGSGSAQHRASSQSPTRSPTTE